MDVVSRAMNTIPNWVSSKCRITEQYSFIWAWKNYLYYTSVPKLSSNNSGLPQHYFVGGSMELGGLESLLKALRGMCEAFIVVVA